MNSRLTESGDLLPSNMATGCLNSIYLKETGLLVSCGKCYLCTQKRRQEWSFRLGEELKNSYSAYFVTLTYAENALPNYNGIGVLHKPDLQNYIKKLRYHQEEHYIEKWKIKRKQLSGRRKEMLPIRYYAVGEYGGQGMRPHYHILLFNLHITKLDEINDSWDKGNVVIGECNPKTINYCTKYLDKSNSHVLKGMPKEFSVMSRNPGIGAEYLAYNSDYHKKQATLTARNTAGHNQVLPRYYRDKIWSKEERKEIIEEHMKDAEEKTKKRYTKVMKHFKGISQYMKSIENDYANIKIKTIKQ